MTEKQRSAPRTSEALASAWERRTLLVKEELAAASAANDAKTQRLRALRLEKEQQDAVAPKPEIAMPARRHMKRIIAQ